VVADSSRAPVTVAEGLPDEAAEFELLARVVGERDDEAVIG
jgi:hypothetical protein